MHQMPFVLAVSLASSLFAAAPTELPPAFCTTKPQAIFSKAPANYAYLPFAAGPVTWGTPPAKVATGCPAFEIERARPHSGIVVKATDFGFSETNRFNAAVLSRAIAYAKEVGADRLELAPGVYRCHDTEGVVLNGLKDFVLDGKGACLVFYRPSILRQVPYWKIEISTDYGNVRVLNCARVEIRDLNVDWDWDVDPLAERVRVLELHLDEKDNASYADVEFVDYAQHPVYPKHLPVQTLANLSESDSPVRFAEIGACSYFGTQEGHHGMKMEWLAPNRARLYPGVRPVAPDSFVHPDYKFSPAANRHFVKNVFKKGGFYRLCHYYVGKNCFDLDSNAHLTLERVNVYSCRGDAFHIEGTQHHWQLVDVAVWPPSNPSRAGGGPKTRPMTTSLDVMHIGCSLGWSKLIRFKCTLNQDDHANFHDRFSALHKTGPREMRITQGRGNAYFRVGAGDRVEFRKPDLSPDGFDARVTSVINDEYLRFDRDIPERYAVTDAFVFNRNRGTDNILVQGCLYDSCWGRFLMLGHNVTFEDCTWRHGIASAVLVQEGVNYGYWFEGHGSGNIVIRNCTFEALQKFNRATFAGVVQDLFVGVDLKDHGRELPVTVWPELLSDVLVENCRFVNPRGAVWHVRNGSRLVFRNNTIDVSGEDPHGMPYRGSVVVEKAAHDVFVSGNTARTPRAAGLIFEK